MLSSVFILHHEYAPKSKKITKGYYRDVIRRLRDAVRSKRPDLWSTDNWRAHHDNAPAHSSHLIQTFLAKNQTPVNFFLSVASVDDKQHLSEVVFSVLVEFSL